MAVVSLITVIIAQLSWRGWMAGMRSLLQAAFLSAFPITSHNGFVEMKFIEYNIARPAFDVRECQQRGLTFAAAVRAKLQMIIYDRESHPQKAAKWTG